VQMRNWEFYAGYFFASPPQVSEDDDWYRYDNHTNTSTRHCWTWREKRWLLGARTVLDAAGKYPVKPLVGAALTYGESRWQTQNLYYFQPDYGPAYVTRTSSTERKSNSLGLMAEGGFRIRTKYPVSFTTVCQVFAHEARFSNDKMDWTPDALTVVMPVWQIGIQYQLPMVKL
jgi:hypothetical protein